MKPSRNVYIFSFTFLGFFLSFLFHAVTEISYIYFLEKDFERYSAGLTWPELMMLHHAFALAIAAAGLYFGYRQGVHWWKVIYEKKL